MQKQSNDWKTGLCAGYSQKKEHREEQKNESQESFNSKEREESSSLSF